MVATPLLSLCHARIGIGATLAARPGHPDRVAVGTLSSLRRLMFEGQTMVVAQIRKTVEGGEAAKTTELAPAEREHRIHQSYEYVHKMAAQDTIIYRALPLHHSHGRGSA